MELTIIGSGNMGSAMLRGLSKYNVLVLEKDEVKIEKLKIDFPNVIFTTENIHNIENRNIILAIKPQIFHNLHFMGKADSIISIMAGVSLDTISAKIKANHYVRAMPNLGAIKNKSITALTGDTTFKDYAIDILSSIGQTVWLDTEKELDIATALSGSGPAYMSLIAESLSDGAVRMGLKREDAYKFTQGLFEGFAEIMKDTHPAIIKDMVMSPAGTTASGYFELEKHNVRGAMMECISSAYNRALELKNNS